MVQGFSFLCSVLMLFFLDNDTSSFEMDRVRRSASSSPIQFSSSSLYGPYVGGETVTFSWSYTNISSNNYSSVNDYIIINCPSYSASPLVSRRVARHALSSGASQSCSYTYKIPEARFNTDSGLVVKVGVQYSGSYLVLLEKPIKPIAKENINPLNYRASPYVIKDRSFYINETSVEEYFLFDEYRDYVEVDEYYRVLFSNLSFIYKYPTAFIYQKANIKFIDKYNLYPDIKKDDDDYTYIPVSLTIKDERVIIDINDIYVNPLTLKCSDKNGEGNKKSRYLFVPKGKGKQIEEYEFIVEVSEIGINKTSFTHCLETSVSPYFLGSCEDADYCVVGGVKE